MYIACYFWVSARLCFGEQSGGWHSGGLGAHTKKGSALLIMSLIGGGVLPLLFGSLLDTYAGYPQTAVLVLIPCYLLILVYATHGHKN